MNRFKKSYLKLMNPFPLQLGQCGGGHGGGQWCWPLVLLASEEVARNLSNTIRLAQPRRFMNYFLSFRAAYIHPLLATHPTI